MPAFRVVWNLPKRSTTTAARSGTMRILIDGAGHSEIRRSVARRRRRRWRNGKVERTREGSRKSARMVWTTGTRACVGRKEAKERRSSGSRAFP